MSQAKQINIGDLRRDLASPDLETRGHALHLLLTAMNRQPEWHDAAREIFRYAVENETSGWLLTTSATGLERLDGPDVARPIWRRLMLQPDGIAAGRAAMSVSDRSHQPMLLELIDARPEFVFRRGAVYALGRMRDPGVIPLLLKLGQDEQSQPAVIQALSEIGDPSAISWLKSLVPSNRPLPEFDERGATWTLGDIASQAIRHIEYLCSRSSIPAAVPLPAAGAAQLKPPPLPPPLPLRSRSGAPPVAGFPAVVRGLLHPSLIPLGAAMLELAWLIFLFAFYLFLVGDERPTFTVSDRAIDIIALPLPMFGLAAAAAVLAGGFSPRAWHKTVAVTGGLLCGFFVFLFGHDLIGR